MSAFFIVFLVVFGQAPEGQTQITVLKKFNSVTECQHEIKVLGLDEKQQESLGCVRMLRGDVKFTEA